MGTADSGQGQSVGDAVLYFLADTANLDVAFTRVADQAATSMGKAADSVSQIGDAADDAGTQLSAAGESATTAGMKITEGMSQSRKATAEARGEAALLGEAFGIHLPRHVRSFVAELPGIGTALSAAFAATAVLFLIEALAKGVEKIQEWSEHAHKMALAWDGFDTAVASSFGGLDDKLLNAGIKMDELKGDHVDALKKALELIDHVSMHELEQEFGTLAKAADALFEQLSGTWYLLDSGSKGAKNALADFKAQYELLLAEGQKKEASDLLAGTLKSAKDALTTMQQAKQEAEEVAKLSAETAGAEPSPVGGPTQKELQSQDALVRVLNAQVEAQKKINELAKDDAFIKQSEEGKRAAEEKAAASKRALDAQLADIETWKAAQHTAYESGKTDLATWLAAEVHAADAATIAHEDYLQKVIALYTRSGQTIKALAAAQELATLQTKDAAKETDSLAAAMNKHREAARKVVEEYAHLIDANLAKDFEATAKATEKLTAAEIELGKAESKLKEDNLSQIYKDRELAITKLAGMHLITEEQKDDRLKLLEQQQANAAIEILNQQLVKEETAVRAAAVKLAEIKLSPGVSPAAVIEAEAELKKLETVVTNTEAQIVATKEKFNKQSEADDKSHYGRALLIAMAAGNELLAEQIKQNHASLLAAQQELALAKARGVDTTAIQQEITALKQNELALEKAATGGKLLTAEKQKFVQQAILAAQAELAEAKARGQNTIAIQQEIIALQKLEKLQQQAPQQMQKMTTASDGLRTATQQLKDMMKSMQTEMSNAYATAIMGALESGKSIGAALEQATKKVLEQLATQALAKSLFYTAQGIADSVWNPAFAAADFSAAAEFAVVAGMAGAVGLAMPGAGSGGGSSAGGPSAGQAQVTQGAGGGSNQNVGVTHLAAGGVVSSKTMFMAGDSPTGGDADEAILPLSDQGAMAKIVNAILPVLPQNAPGFGWASPSQAPPKGFDLSQPSSSDRPDIHSGNPNDGDFERSEPSMPRDMMGMEALAASFGGLLSTTTLRGAASSVTQGARAAAAASAPTGFDGASMEKFADRVGSQIKENGGGGDSGDTTHIHMNIKGMVSPDNAKKFLKQVNRMVQNRQTTLNSTNSLRVTRRSQ